jgi:muramoyltetrapeptide carboxypeptidase
MTRTIGIVAPADWLEPETLKAGVNVLRKAGLQVKIAANVGKKWGRMAGKPEVRAEALMQMARDPKVDFLLAAAAGHGGLQILDLLDWKALAKAQKPLMGFSDTTALLSAWQRYGCGEAWHGMNLRSIARDDAVSTATLLKVLKGEDFGDIVLTRGAKVALKGSGQGLLVGGNLAIVSSTLGTPYAPPAEGAKILFFEEIDEPIYRIDRWLHQLRHAGYYRNLKGVLVGGMSRIADSTSRDFGFSLEQLWKQHFGALGIPVITHFPAGHEKRNLPLPLGKTITLKTTPHVSVEWK